MGNNSASMDLGVGLTSAPEGLELACFAAGCFWGVETTLACVPGVVTTRAGYTGGDVERPTYKQVCYKSTGHAEAVLLTFDPKKLSYDSLLETFFSCHNPTTLNRQGPDIGSQYRSAIFYFSEEQKASAEAAIKRQQPNFRSPIVTQVVPAQTFWNAEDYHQKYALQAYHRKIFESLKLGSVKELLDSPLVTKLNGYVTGTGSKATAEELFALPMPDAVKELLKTISFEGPACAFH